jgi:hypothetical protein
VLKSDLLFYPLLWITTGSPLIWLLLFFIVRKRQRSKKAFFALLTIYVVTVLFFTYKLSTARGWSGLDWIERGITVIGALTFVSGMLIIAVRLLLPRKP